MRLLMLAPLVSACGSEISLVEAEPEPTVADPDPGPEEPGPADDPGTDDPTEDTGDLPVGAPSTRTTCAAAAREASSAGTHTFCLSPPDLVLGPSSSANAVWLAGPIYAIDPAP